MVASTGLPSDKYQMVSHPMEAKIGK